MIVSRKKSVNRNAFTTTRLILTLKHVFDLDNSVNFKTSQRIEGWKDNQNPRHVLWTRRVNMKGDCASILHPHTQTNRQFQAKSLLFRFSISFMDDKGNIYFHFNPRPQEKCLIINACLNGNWGKEERKFVQKFPFLPMQYFEASFVLMEDKFTVSKMWKFLNCKAMISFYKQWVILDILHLLLFTISCTFRCS